MKAPDFWFQPAGSLAATLAPLGWLYGAVGTWRRFRTRPYAAGIPVLCVGNLTAGGQGKTPVALALARLATEAGGLAGPVHFLTRGYRGALAGPIRVDPACHDADQVGDEALLLARAAPTWVARDRAAGARAAAAAGAGLLILDDGFQNPGLAKDGSLIVVDGATGFGNRHLVPAGPLREPVAHGLARSDAVVILGADRTGTAPSIAGRKPVWAARLEPDPGVAAALCGRPVVGFAGIGRPAKFFQTLAETGARVLACHAFPDHHRYRPEQVMTIVEQAAALGAVPVTTEKDAVRLPPEARAMITTLPVTVAWHDPSAPLRLLANLARTAEGRGDGP